MTKGATMPAFDEAGNMILKKTESEPPPEVMEEILAAGQAIKNSMDMVKKYESEPEPESFHCQYCESEWKSKVSKDRHEVWCKDNPNRRTSYRKPMTKINPKKNPKPKTTKPKDIIKELKAFDKVFGLTDGQIVKYIRGLMK